MGRLAEDYLLDSDANIRVVVGLDIECDKRVTQSIVDDPTNRDELRVIQEAFRDDQGNATNHVGLQLHLSDFASKEEMGDLDQKLIISARQLCEFRNRAEVRSRRMFLIADLLPAGVQKRKRSEKHPKEIASGDDARYVE